MSSSVFRFLEEAVESGANQPALLHPVRGEFQQMSWQDAYDRVMASASALLAIDTQANDRIAIISNTRVEWTIIDLAAMAVGGVTVPLYHSCGEEDFFFILKDCGARVLFVENVAQLQRLRTFRSKLPHLEHVVIIDEGVDLEKEAGEIFFAEFLQKTKGRDDRAAIRSRVEAVKADDLASIVYTSGTTGNPKGAMLTHDNFAYEAHAIEKLGLIVPGDVQLLFLPLAHIFARILQVSWLKTRHLLAYAEGVDHLADNMKTVRPTVLAAVPRVFERIHGQIVSQGLATPGFKKRLVKWAFDVASEKAKQEMAGETSSSISWSIADSLVFSKVNERLAAQLGGRMRITISGGAPLSPQITYFFKFAGLTILEGWGLSETAAATCVNVVPSNRIGTVGKPVPGTEVKFDEDNEILVKGRGVFKGYWNNPEATRAAFTPDGFFRTGDIGVLQAGYLKITDRKKDIIVTAGGKKIAPQKLEGMYKSSNPLLAQAVVLGDNKPFCVGLFTLDEKTLKAFARSHGLSGSFSALTKQPLVRSEIEKSLAEVNAHLAEFEQVRKFAILDHEFAVGEQLTPTLKVKRKYCADRYKDVYEHLYST